MCKYFVIEPIITGVIMNSVMLPSFLIYGHKLWKNYLELYEIRSQMIERLNSFGIEIKKSKNNLNKKLNGLFEKMKMVLGLKD